MSVSDESISTVHPSRLIAYQSVRTNRYSEAGLVREQALDPDKKATGPALRYSNPEATKSPKNKKDERLAMPDWAKIFSPGGSLKDEVDINGAKRQN